MPVRALTLAIACCLLLAPGLAGPALGLGIQGFGAATPDSDFTTADSSFDVEFASSASAIDFSTSYDVVVTAQYPSGTGPTHDPIGGLTEIAPQMEFSIELDVIALPTELWELELTALLDASVSILDDAPGTARAYLSQASVRRGSDSLITLIGIPETTVSGAANESQGHTIQGQGTEHISLVLTAALDLDSLGANEGLIFCGVRPCGISYSVGDSVGATVGYELNGQLSFLPEPAIGLLVGLGSAGLGVRMRRRRV